MFPGSINQMNEINGDTVGAIKDSKGNYVYPIIKAISNERNKRQNTKKER